MAPPAARLIGRRRPDARPGELPDDVRPGDYWRLLGDNRQPLRSSHLQNLTGEVWHVVPPLGGTEDWMLGRLELHTVREHEDGTISVRPGDGSSNSILVENGGGLRWHGFIEHGEWLPLTDCST